MAWVTAVRPLEISPCRTAVYRRSTTVSAMGIIAPHPFEKRNLNAINTMTAPITSHGIDIFCLATRNKHHEKYH